MLNEFKAYIKPYAEKIENLLKFGKVLKVNGVDGQLQKVQLKTLRNIEDAMKVSNFGFNSKAPNGSRCVVAEISNEKIVIANEHLASIIDVDSGDSIHYNESGTYIKLEGNKIISSCSEYIVNASSKATFNTPLVEFSSNHNVLGLLSANSYSGLGGSSMTTNVNLETTQDVVASGISLNSHTHGGVMVGGANTNIPN